MIFITLGSQKFQFNRLLKKVDVLVEKNVIVDDIFAQIGASDYLPRNFDFVSFLDGNEFEQKVEQADVIITHGGTGNIFAAVKKGKKVIAIPRRAKYQEHVDDHQIQILEELDKMGIIEICKNLEDLEVSYENVMHKKYKKYRSSNQAMIASIEECLRCVF
ncbi:MAG: beta(1,3)galactosyltransferase EpsH [Lachnospiraceae bacterium]|nr:beta(1,3)galactosyltransferase EpsH [Lachnospiraceae bacterium]